MKAPVLREQALSEYNVKGMKGLWVPSRKAAGRRMIPSFGPVFQDDHGDGDNCHDQADDRPALQVMIDRRKRKRNRCGDAEQNQ